MKTLGERLAWRALRVSALVVVALWSVDAEAQFTRFKWKAQDQPPVREAPAFAYDSARSRYVLFGGSSTAGSLSDVWEWTGTTWVAGAPFIRPSARGSMSALFDSDTSRTAIFGGTGSSTYNDVWLWNGSSWLRPQPLKSPSTRTDGAMVYDSLRKRWVLFGGTSSTGLQLTDTWEYDASTDSWAEMMPAVSPPARWYPTAVFDSKTGKTILFGGAFETPDSQPMWEWNGATWTERPDLAKMPGFGGAAFAYDAKRDRIVKFGGLLAGYSDETYEYTYGDAAWVAKAPAHKPAAGPGVTIYDSGRERVALYQGLTSELWEWDGSDWSHVGPGLSPAKRGLAALTYDSDRKKVVIFGGAVATPLLDTWEWDGASWNEKTPAGVSPPGSVYSAFVYDTVRKEAVLAPGGTGETWVWNGLSWAKKNPATPYGGIIAGMAAAFDSVRGKMFLFGGEDEFSFPKVYLNDTWAWNGTDWAKVTTASAPSARWLHGMAFDEERKQTVLFGGALDEADSVFSDETWLFDGADWTKANPAHHPSARSSARMTWDPTRKAVVLFSGKSPAVTSDVWTWNGTDWTLLDVDPTPVANAYSTLLSFDGNTLMAFGTASRLNSTATLLLVPKTESCTKDSECALGTFCVDGVCCGTNACNTCETCNGLSPGTCTPIFNDEDADSCASAAGRTCDGRGTCRGALGATCAADTECASNHCVDGVCCDTSCDGTCVACSATLKEEGARSGLCGASKNGTDPRNQCDEVAATTCSFDGTCDGKGGCRLYQKGTVCDTAAVCTGIATASARVCDGFGACGNDPQPLECKEYRCVTGAGCPTSCTEDDQCANGFFCRSNACVVVKTGCQSVEDCAPGFVCSFEGTCIVPPEVLNDEGCSASSSRPTPLGWLECGGTMSIAGGLLVRRRRSKSVRGAR